MSRHTYNFGDANDDFPDEDQWIPIPAPEAIDDDAPPEIGETELLEYNQMQKKRSLMKCQFQKRLLLLKRRNQRKVK